MIKSKVSVIDQNIEKVFGQRGRGYRYIGPRGHEGDPAYRGDAFLYPSLKIKKQRGRGRGRRKKRKNQREGGHF